MIFLSSLKILQSVTCVCSLTVWEHIGADLSVNPKCIGGGRIQDSSCLSKSPITKIMHIDAILKYLCKLYFFTSLVYPVEFSKNYCVWEKSYDLHWGGGGSKQADTYILYEIVKKNMDYLAPPPPNSFFSLFIFSFLALTQKKS